MKGNCCILKTTSSLFNGGLPATSCGVWIYGNMVSFMRYKKTEHLDT